MYRHLALKSPRRSGVCMHGVAFRLCRPNPRPRPMVDRWREESSEPRERLSLAVAVGLVTEFGFRLFRARPSGRRQRVGNSGSDSTSAYASDEQQVSVVYPDRAIA